MKHLDEGTIHAWLDGELPNDDQDIERHVAACPECSARVAEARGLIAGASRILSALDDVGAGIVPEQPAEVTRTRTRRWVRPVSWLAAAGLIVAVGVKTVGNRQSDSPTVGRSDSQTVGQSGGRTVGRSDSQAVRQSDSLMNRPSVAMTPAAPAPMQREAAKSVGVAPREAAKSVAVAAPSPPPALALDSVSGNAVRPAASASVQAKAMGGAPAAAAELGRVPLCFVEMPAAIRGAAADVQRAAAGAAGATGRVGVESAVRALQPAFASNALMLDTTPVAGGAARRQLRDSSGVVGEWARVGADLVMLQYAGRVRLAAVMTGGLRMGETVLVATGCGPGRE